VANTLVFYADYTKSGVGAAPSPAPTIAVYKVDRSAGTESVAVAAGAAMTASSLTGRYYYRLTGADLQTYDYHARATTSDTSVDRRDQPALWVRWSEAVATDAAGAVAVGDKTGFSLAAGSLSTAVFAAGATVPRVTLVDTVTTLTGHTPQTGDAFARIGAAGAGLTSLGDARLANLDATVSSRSTYAGADTAGTTTLLARLTSGRATNLDNLDAAVSTRLALTSYSAAPTAAAISTQVAADLATAHGAGPWTAADVSALATAAALASVASDVAAILDDTGTSGVVVAAGSKLGYSLATAPPTASQIVTALKTTTVTFRDVTAVTAPTVEDCWAAGFVEAVCNEAIVGTTYAKLQPDNATTFVTATLDDATAPTSRTR
jgi:hypothetical protein